MCLTVARADQTHRRYPSAFAASWHPWTPATFGNRHARERTRPVKGEKVMGATTNRKPTLLFLLFGLLLLRYAQAALF
jgi:hypothetical protein